MPERNTPAASQLGFTLLVLFEMIIMRYKSICIVIHIVLDRGVSA
jgi:hypothetical protein